MDKLELWDTDYKVAIIIGLNEIKIKIFKWKKPEISVKK